MRYTGFASSTALACRELERFFIVDARKEDGEEAVDEKVAKPPDRSSSRSVTG